jgi:hypothetical protein
VVDLGDDGEAIVFYTLDHPQLPKRFVSIERGGDDTPGEMFELGLGAGSGEGAVPEVVVEGEVLVVDPDWAAVVGDPFETLAITRDVLELGGDVGPYSGDVDPAIFALERSCVEQRHPGDVHMAGPGFEREERGVEIAQRLVVNLTHL